MSFRFATRWSLTTLALMAVACAANTASASLQSFGLYNTGVDNSGVALSPLPADDSHYTLTAAPAGVNLSVSATGRGAPWLANTSTSNWVTPTQYATSNGLPATAPGGLYTYTLNFNSPGSWLTVNGRWSTDNGGELYLNNVLVSTTASGAFSSWTAFTLEGIQAGANTLEFKVTNGNQASGNPTGLRVEFTAFQVPEATSVAVWGGLSLLGVVARRRRS